MKKIVVDFFSFFLLIFFLYSIEIYVSYYIMYFHENSKFWLIIFQLCYIIYFYLFYFSFVLFFFKMYFYFYLIMY